MRILVSAYKDAVKKTARTGAIAMAVAVFSVLISQAFLLLLSSDLTFGYEAAEVHTQNVIAPLLIFVLMIFSFVSARRVCGHNSEIAAASGPRNSMRRFAGYFSAAAAVISWQLVIIIIAVAADALLGHFRGAYFRLGFLFGFVAVYLACAAMLTGASLLAHTFADDKPKRIMLYFLILCLPFFWKMSAIYITDNLIQYSYNYEEWGLLTDPRYDIPAMFLLNFIFRLLIDPYSLFSYINIDSAITSENGALYTLSLGLLLLLAGAAVFSKSGAVKGGAALRGLISAVYASSGIVFIIIKLYSNDTVIQKVIFCALHILAAAAVCFIIEYYENANFKKAAGGAIVPFCAAFLIGGTLELMLLFGIHSFESFTPNAADISAVSFPDGNCYTKLIYDVIEKPGYGCDKISDLRFSDSKIKSIVAEALPRMLVYYEKRGDHNYDDDVYKFWYTVLIHMKSGRSVTRHIKISEEEKAAIIEIAGRDKRYLRYITELPPEDTVLGVFIEGAAETDSLRIWEAFRREFSAIPSEDKRRGALFEGHSLMFLTEYEDEPLIFILGSSGMKYYINVYRINGTTPEVLAIYNSLQLK